MFDNLIKAMEMMEIEGDRQNLFCSAAYQYPA
jgi:hypothetical protein